MKEEDIPDQNLFMMCESLNRTALTGLPVGYSLRNCRPDELSIWKKMPFDDPDLATEYDGFMTDYLNMTYGGKEDLFFAKTLFVCDEQDEQSPVIRLLSETDDRTTTFETIEVMAIVDAHGKLTVQLPQSIEAGQYRVVMMIEHAHLMAE
jgi:hypothetical protein